MICKLDTVCKQGMDKLDTDTVCKQGTDTVCKQGTDKLAPLVAQNKFGIVEHWPSPQRTGR